MPDLRKQVNAAQAQISLDKEDVVSVDSEGTPSPEHRPAAAKAAFIPPLDDALAPPGGRTMRKRGATISGVVESASKGRLRAGTVRRAVTPNPGATRGMLGAVAAVGKQKHRKSSREHERANGDLEGSLSLRASVRTPQRSITGYMVKSKVLDSLKRKDTGLTQQSATVLRQMASSIRALEVSKDFLAQKGMIDMTDHVDMITKQPGDMGMPKPFTAMTKDERRACLLDFIRKDKKEEAFLLTADPSLPSEANGGGVAATPLDASWNPAGDAGDRLGMPTFSVENQALTPLLGSHAGAAAPDSLDLAGTPGVDANGTVSSMSVIPPARAFRGTAVLAKPLEGTLTRRQVLRSVQPLTKMARHLPPGYRMRTPHITPSRLAPPPECCSKHQPGASVPRMPGRRVLKDPAGWVRVT